MMEELDAVGIYAMQSISYTKQQQSNVFLSIIFIILLLSANMSSSIQALSTKTTTSSTRKAISSMPRIELFFSSTDELRKRITFLKSKGVSSFNIVNKSNRDDILQSVKTIQEEFFSSSEEDDHDNASLLSICAHYSMKYNKSRKMDGAYLQLRDYIDNMNNLEVDPEETKEKKKATTSTMKNEILLITGSGPKGKLCSLTALQRLQKEYIASSPPPPPTSIHTSMAVAFNPFFPNEQDYNEERLRLQEKLATGLVSKVYIQFGTDLERLHEALQELTMLQQQQHQQSYTATTPFEICGSIFLPTKKLIAQQKFRPWNGVFLNDEFLSSEYGAKQIVLQMMRLYEEYSCEILIEAPGVRNEKDWDVVQGLLNDRDELLLSKPQMVAAVVEKCNDDVADSGNNNEIVDSSTTSRKRRQTAPASESAVKKVQQADISSMKSNLPPTDMSSNVLSKSAIVLFHSHDVRLHDNVALQMASHHNRKHVIPVFLWSKKEQGLWGVRGCLEVVLKDALCNLDRKLRQYGLKLICREGDDSSTMLRELCEECSDIGAVYWNKEHTPESRMRDEKYQAVLQEIGVESLQCQSSLLYDPTSPSLAAGFHGGHWGTLMPFKRTCEKQLDEPRRPIPRAETFFMLECMEGPTNWPASKAIDELDIAVINGNNKWSTPILERFPMSEDAAIANMNAFIKYGFEKYERDRSRADIEWATSKLSAHLRIGTLSPNALYYKIEDSNLDYNERKTISRRLIWRDLAYFHLYSFPSMRDTSIRLHYEQTEWCSGIEEQERFNAWKSGQTGYPLVDAGMRELYKTGWMTQSVRMVVASFLVEYLRVNWTKGADWFHYTLVDADSAINSMMWQNAGRSGIDQWNFVMSPVAASQDASGDYTRKWCPELSKLPKAVLHKPWEAPIPVLEAAGVILGTNYPLRIVSDLKAERSKSVEAVLKMRSSNQQSNSERGYDMITLPDGKQTVVFTKKEFRIDRQGNVLKEAAATKKSAGRGRGKGKTKAKDKNSQKKLLRKKAAEKK